MLSKAETIISALSELSDFTKLWDVSKESISGCSVVSSLFFVNSTVTFWETLPALHITSAVPAAVPAIRETLAFPLSDVRTDVAESLPIFVENSNRTPLIELRELSLTVAVIREEVVPSAGISAGEGVDRVMDVTDTFGSTAVLEVKST